MNKKFLLGLLIALSITMCSCAVSVYAGNDNPAAELNYISVWNRDWNQIVIDTKPYLATQNSPGVCNVGGGSQNCYRIDKKVAASFRTLSRDLSKVGVPTEYQKANTTIQQSIKMELKGLSERDTLIVTQNEYGSLAPSNATLARVIVLIKRGVGQFQGVYKPQSPFK